MPLCNKCGETIAEGSSFCAFCGAPAATTEPQAAPLVPPASETAPPAYPTISQPMAVPGRNTFLNSYLSVAVLAVLFIGMLIYGSIAIPGQYFSYSRILSFAFAQLCILGPIALAAAISTRAKGPDFSIGSVMALSSAVIGVSCFYSVSPILGIVISLLACAVVGLFNGAFIAFLRAPAIVVTILTSVIVRVVVNVLLDGMTLAVDKTITEIANYTVGDLSLGGIIILAVTFIAAFLLIMLTKLGVPTYKRDKKPALTYMFAYMASAVIAGIAGIFMASRNGAASPIAGYGYEPFIVLVFACVVGSRVMDNRFAPAVYALVPALFISIFQTIASIIMLDVYMQTILQVVIAVVLLAIAFLSRRFSSSYGED